MRISMNRRKRIVITLSDAEFEVINKAASHLGHPDAIFARSACLVVARGTKLPTTQAPTPKEKPIKLDPYNLPPESQPRATLDENFQKWREGQKNL